MAIDTTTKYLDLELILSSLRYLILSVIECDIDSSGYYYSYKVFGSGTQLIVTDPNDPNKKEVKKPQVNGYSVSTPQSNGKSVLLCQARGMFPELLRFIWTANDQSGKNVDLNSYEQLEQRDKDPEVQITSMLIVEQNIITGKKFNCKVHHESSSDYFVIIPKEEDITKTETKPGMDTCPSEEEKDDIRNFDVHEVSHNHYLFSVTYVILLVKNLLYFCTVSVLLFKRNPGNVMFRNKVH